MAKRAIISGGAAVSEEAVISAGIPAGGPVDGPIEMVEMVETVETVKAIEAVEAAATDDFRRARQIAFDKFLELNPHFKETAVLDKLRTTDFARLDIGGHVYLDYTGGSLYPASLVKRHTDLLLHQVFGNPHSSNPTSIATTELVEGCRRHVLDFFNAPDDEYVVIFTANASQSLKLVGESYPFTKGDQFLLLFDNHNSVNGIREFDRAAGATTTYIPVEPPDLRAVEEGLDAYFDLARPDGNNLFAYPAQSNFSGVQHPMEWIERAQAKGWDVLLDAAAFVPTNRLDLSRWKPDFVALSFYKMFGYPTGVGALIGRRDALAKLHRPWFAGGTIGVASVQADRYTRAHGAAAFEDGTLNYEILPAVDMGLDFLETVGIDTVHERVSCLASWLIESLIGLRHRSGRPLFALYGPREMELRGGNVTFNFLNSLGQVIDHQEVERRANERKISLRTGCFCNPGAGELALGITKTELDGCFAISNEHMTYSDFRRCVDSDSTGAVRVSVGLATNFQDVYAFVDFARTFLQD